jgi:L-ribulose-5-phosphate 3-epimerase
MLKPSPLRSAWVSTLFKSPSASPAPKGVCFSPTPRFSGAFSRPHPSTTWPSQARTWTFFTAIRQAIQITSKLNASIVELAFFFKCGLNNARDIDAVVGALRELAPEAQAANVLLGIENTLSAEENARILDRVASPAVKVWYDVGNSTNMGHFDVPREIRFLGKDRIGQIHIKDKVYLGQGAVDVKGCLEAIFDIGYTGFCVLETAAPTGDRVADAAKNLQLLRAIEKQIRRR